MSFCWNQKGSRDHGHPAGRDNNAPFHTHESQNNKRVCDRENRNNFRPWVSNPQPKQPSSWSRQRQDKNDKGWF